MFSVQGCMPDIHPRECIKKCCSLGNISKHPPLGAGIVLDDMAAVDHII